MNTKLIRAVLLFSHRNAYGEKEREQVRAAIAELNAGPPVTVPVAAVVVSGYSGDPDTKGSKGLKVIDLADLPVGTKLYASPPVTVPVIDRNEIESYKPVCVVEISDFITLDGESKKAVRELYKGALRIGETLYAHTPVTVPEESVDIAIGLLQGIASRNTSSYAAQLLPVIAMLKNMVKKS